MRGCARTRAQTPGELRPLRARGRGLAAPTAAVRGGLTRGAIVASACAAPRGKDRPPDRCAIGRAFVSGPQPPASGRSRRTPYHPAAAGGPWRIAGYVRRDPPSTVSYHVRRTRAGTAIPCSWPPDVTVPDLDLPGTSGTHPDPRPGVRLSGDRRGHGAGAQDTWAAPNGPPRMGTAH